MRISSQAYRKPLPRPGPLPEPRPVQHRPLTKPQPSPRDEGIMINRRQYETAIKTTPLGQLVPIPTITIPPVIVASSPDPYGLDESNESDEGNRPPPPKDNAPLDNGYIPVFWGVQPLWNKITRSNLCFRIVHTTYHALTLCLWDGQ